MIIGLDVRTGPKTILQLAGSWQFRHISHYLLTTRRQCDTLLHLMMFFV